MIREVERTALSDELEALRAIIQYASEEADRLGRDQLTYLLRLASLEAAEAAEAEREARMARTMEIASRKSTQHQ